MSKTGQGARLTSVDALKGAAALAVVVLHALPSEWLVGSWGVFHIWQAVPVFLLLLGFTGYLTRVRPFGDYLKRRAKRLLVPFAIVWVLVFVIGLVTGTLLLGPDLLLGRMPVKSMPGNYFISLLFQFVLILPLLRMLLDRSPALMLVVCGVLEAAFRASEVLLRAQSEYLYQSSILRVLFTVALGLWLAQAPKNRRTKLVALAFAAVSAAYLAFAQLTDPDPARLTLAYAQSGIAAGIPLALVALLLDAQMPSWMVAMGKASYHILLVQMVWFGQVVNRLDLRTVMNPWVLLALSLPLCALLGYAAFRLDEYAWKSRPAPASATP